MLPIVSPVTVKLKELVGKLPAVILSTLLSLGSFAQVGVKPVYEQL